VSFRDYETFFSYMKVKEYTQETLNICPLGIEINWERDECISIKKRKKKCS